MRIALVTGGTSGMGLEFTKQIQKACLPIDEIWVISRRAKENQAASKIRFFSLDLEKEGDCLKLKQELERRQPTIKLLVNAAGAGYTGDFAEVELKAHRRMTRLNAEALMAVTYLCLPYMHPGSRILQLCSGSAFAPQPGFAIYAATKAYVERFSNALRMELKERRILVTLVCPGPVDTPFFETACRGCEIPDYKKAAMAKPEEVVRKALLDSLNGKRYSIYGLPMKAFFIASKLLPHELITKAVVLMNKKSKG